MGDNKLGNFYEPTIFNNVFCSTIAQEEIFGPVTSVFDFKDEEQAIDIKFKLWVSIWYLQLMTVQWTAERIQAVDLAQ